MGEAGTSDRVTVAAVVGGGVSGSTGRVDPAGRVREAAGPGEPGRPAAAGAAVAAAVGGAPAAAAAAAGAGAAAAAAAPVREAAGSRADLGDPAGSEGPALAAAAAEAAVVAGGGRKGAVLAENAGAGCREAGPEWGRGALGTVGKGIPTVRAGPAAAKGDPAGSREFQNRPGAGRGTTAAADQGVEGGRADRNSSDSAVRSLPGLAVRRPTSRRDQRGEKGQRS